MRRLFLFVGLTSGLLAQTEPGSVQRLYGDIVRRMYAELGRVEQNTCLETLRRFELDTTGRVIYADESRVEVGSVQGREFYGAQGASLEKNDPSQLVRPGLVGTGELFLYTKQIFFDPHNEMRYAGIQTVDGRNYHRFLYKVPLTARGFTLQTEFGVADVPYHGEALIDVTTELPHQLTIVGDDIPARLGTKAFQMIMRFDSGGPEVSARPPLLPRSNMIVFDRFDGMRSVSNNVWSHCREFSSEARMEDEDAALGAKQLASAVLVPLEKGTIVTSLTHALPLADLTPGTRFEMKVARDVRFGLYRLSKGQSVPARVLRVERQNTRTLVSLAIESIPTKTDEGAPVLLRFTALPEKLESKQRGVEMVPGTPPLPEVTTKLTSEEKEMRYVMRMSRIDLPGVVMLEVPTDATSIEALTIVWKHEAAVPAVFKNLQQLPRFRRL